MALNKSARSFKSVATSGWFGPSDLLVDRQGAPIERPGLVHATRSLQQSRQVVEDGSESRGVRIAVGLEKSPALEQQRLGFPIPAKVSENGRGRNRGVGPGLPFGCGSRIGRRHGPLEGAEGTRIPLRTGRLAKSGQRRGAFEHG